MRCVCFTDKPQSNNLFLLTLENYLIIFFIPTSYKQYAKIGNFLTLKSQNCVLHKNTAHKLLRFPTTGLLTLPEPHSTQNNIKSRSSGFM